MLRAIARDRAEINPAPVRLRLSCALAAQLPTVAARLLSRGGPDESGRLIVEAQRAAR